MNVGQVIDEKYELLECIGEGAFGFVYLSRHIELNKHVALKVLRPEAAKWQDKLGRFEREARAAGQLKHPGICRVLDFGALPDGRPYAVMEFVEGLPLAKLIAQKQHFAAADAVDLLAPICAALAVAHHAGIIHRDLNPNNIIVKPDGQPVIVDFGLAKVADFAISGGSLTDAGSILGTPDYMSPEQCTGQPVDARTDVYSLGCILYEMLSGKVPFKGETVMAVLYSQTQDQPPPFDPQLAIPNHIQLAVMKALEKDPAHRQSSVEQLQKQLQSQPGSNTWLNNLKLHRRAYALVPIIAGTLAIGALAAAGMYFYTQSHQSQTGQTDKVSASAQTTQRLEQLRQEATALDNTINAGRFADCRAHAQRIVFLCQGAAVPPAEAAEYLMRAYRAYANPAIGIDDDNTPDLILTLAIQKYRQFCKPTSPYLIKAQIELIDLKLIRCMPGEVANFGGADPDNSEQLYECRLLLEDLLNSLQRNGGSPQQINQVLMTKASWLTRCQRYEEAANLFLSALPQLRSASFAGDAALARLFYDSLTPLAVCRRLSELQDVTDNVVVRGYRSFGGRMEQAVPAIYLNTGEWLMNSGQPEESYKYAKKALAIYAVKPQFTAGLEDEIRQLKYNTGLGPKSLFQKSQTERFQKYLIALRSEKNLAPLSRSLHPGRQDRAFVAGPYFEVGQLGDREQLRHLNVLDLKATKVSDSDVKALGEMPQLQALDLSMTNITDAVGSALPQFPKLEFACFSASPIAMKTATALARLPQLKYLSLAFPEGGDNMMDAIARSKSLESLVLDSVPITDAGLQKLAQLKTLKSFVLVYTHKVSDKGLAALAALPQLDSLVISGSPIAGSCLSQFKHLRSIVVEKPCRGDFDISGIGGCSQLQRLEVPRMPVTDAQLQVLPQLKELQILVLERTAFGDKTAAMLPQLSHLRLLAVGFTNITDAGLAQIGRCANLQVLTLAYNAVHDISPLAGLTKLRTLNLRCTAVDDSAEATLSSLKNLESLDVSRTRLSGSALIGIVRSTAIKTLRVDGINLSEPQRRQLQQILTVRMLPPR